MDQNKPIIYDCFTFFNELELLEIRLNELSHLVDYFVLVESTRTHSNKNKPLYFESNKDKFKKFEEKIIHAVVDEFPEYKDSWTFENHQRNYIKDALGKYSHDSVIMISDADEIPSPQAILTAMETPGIKILEQNLFYYYFNMLCQTKPKWTHGTRLLRGEEFNMSANEIILEQDWEVIPNGGWHFSYLGGNERIKTKIEAFAHQEFNTEEFKSKENISKAINSGKDIYGRKISYKPIILDNSFPKYLLENKMKYEGFIYKHKSLMGKLKSFWGS